MGVVTGDTKHTVTLQWKEGWDVQPENRNWWMVAVHSFILHNSSSFIPSVEPESRGRERKRDRESSVSAGVVLLFNVVCSQKKKHKGMYLFGHVATNACEKIKPPLTRSSNAETLLAISFWNGAGFYNSMMLSWQQHFLCSARTITEAPSATQYMIQHILAGMCAGVFFSSVSGGFSFGGTKTKCREMNKNTMSVMESSDDSQMF